jgi:hypothetical protein
MAALPALAAKTHTHATAKTTAAKTTTAKSTARKTAAAKSAPHKSGVALHRASASRNGKHSKGASVANPHGHLAQVSMDTERATQIQQALIKSGYMTGEPTGKWDAASIGAMQKLQADNGWQTKIMPDSRALIKLGLGPGAGASADNSLSASAAAPATAQTGSRQ